MERDGTREDEAGRAGGGRPLRARRPLPGGRAVAGGFLVAAAAVGLFASYLQATARPANRYVVARRAVAIGHTIASTDLALGSMDLPAAVAAHAFRNPSDIAGRVALAPIAAGQLMEDTGLAGRGATLDGRQVA